MFFKEQLNIINELDKIYKKIAGAKKDQGGKKISELKEQASELEERLLNESDEGAKPLLEEAIEHIKRTHGQSPRKQADLEFEEYERFPEYRKLFQPDEETFKSRYQYLLCLCKLAYLEERNGVPKEHAFKLALLFNSEKEAIDNLLKFISQASNLTKEEQKGKNKDEIALLKSQKERAEFNLHNACLFGIPSPSSDWETWRKLAKSEFTNKDFRNLLSIAEDIEELIKKNMTKKTSYAKEEKQKIINEIKICDEQIANHKKTIATLNKEIKQLKSEDAEYESKKNKREKTKEEIENLEKVIYTARQKKYHLTKEYDPILISYKTQELEALNSQYKKKLGKQNTAGMNPSEKMHAKEELSKLASQLSEKRIEIFLLSAGLSFERYSITQLICCAEFRKKGSANDYLAKNGLAKVHIERFLGLNREQAGINIPDLKINGDQYSFPEFIL